MPGSPTAASVPRRAGVDDDHDDQRDGTDHPDHEAHAVAPVLEGQRYDEPADVVEQDDQSAEAPDLQHQRQQSDVAADAGNRTEDALPPDESGPRSAWLRGRPP